MSRGAGPLRAAHTIADTRASGKLHGQGRHSECLPNKQLPAPRPLHESSQDRDCAHMGCKPVWGYSVGLCLVGRLLQAATPALTTQRPERRSRASELPDLTAGRAHHDTQQPPRHAAP